MTLMSDGLRAIGGNALRSLLQKWTGTRLSSVATGTAITALAQSSSATTLATIGFVSAGLLTFTQAVGVIFGANLGTTMTSWLVALVGLKIKISTVALPMVGAGAFLKLLARGRRAQFGAVLAGFGLIFVGIDVLQAGMLTVSESISPADLAIDGLLGRLLLIGVGILMTVVTQSSSAAIAATLTALSSGAIDLPQAASLVIGQNVGTTITAAMGSIGATIPARRTALAHILFNVLTGLIAFAILPLFLELVQGVTSTAGAVDNATVIAAFHTAFNLLGVLVMLPFLVQFSHLVERIVPGPERMFTSGLDSSAQLVPTIGLDATARAIISMFEALIDAVLEGLDNPDRAQAVARLEPHLEEGIARTRDFLRGVQTTPSDEELFARHVAVLHALDHLQRCLVWARETDLFEVAVASEPLDEPRELLVRELAKAAQWLDSANETRDTEGIHKLAEQITDSRQKAREALIAKAARDRIDVAREQHALNWMNRIGHHVWRATHHLSGKAATPSQAAEPME
jgi:phosphate:Na+ symporter